MDPHRLPLHVLQQRQSTCAQRCVDLRQRLQQAQTEVDALRQRYEILTQTGADLRIAIDQAVASSWDSHLRERWRNAAGRRIASVSAEAALDRLVASLVDERQRYARKISDLEELLEIEARLRDIHGRG